MIRSDLDSYDVPDMPGVYFFIAGRKILYIGKATSLRDRVRSYFSKDLADMRSPLIAAMVERATAIKWQETGSVLEALILEANLIKKHQPPHNTDEKDDKSFNYLVITKEEFPRVLVMRGRELAQKWGPRQIKKTFGPFPHGGALKEAVKIVRKIFPFRDTCTPDLQNMAQTEQATPVPGKPCFNAQIGLCPGVCGGRMTKAQYAHTIRSITELFKGNFHGLKRRLGKEMQAAARAERFEEASTLRKQINALEHIRDVSLIKNVNDVNGAHSQVRIEAYDVAHTSGTETVGVMVVVQGGEALKSDYRKFKVRGFTNDDPGALGEILSRRLAHLEWPLPRLIVLDGGTAQMRAAMKVLKQAGISIPLVGVVKNERHKPERLIGDTRLGVTHEREILLANAEAHRFAIGWHRARRLKAML